jgi:hypothetical protein
VPLVDVAYCACRQQGYGAVGDLAVFLK